MVFYFILSSSSMNVQNSESICVIVCKLVKAPPYKLQDDHCSFYDIVYPEKDTQINHHDFMKAPIIRQSHEQWQNLGHCTHRKKLSFNQAISLFSAIFFCDKVFSDHNTQIAVTTKKGQIGEQALDQLKGVFRKDTFTQYVPLSHYHQSFRFRWETSHYFEMLSARSTLKVSIAHLIFPLCSL